MSDEDRLRRVSKQLRAVQRLASAHLLREMGREMQDLELSFSQMGALVHVRQAGSLSVSGLAERLRLSVPATSQVVERNVGRDLLHRQEDPGDRRSKKLALTPAGAALLDRVEEASILAYGALLRDMTGADLEALEEALARLLPADRSCSHEKESV